MPEHEGRRHAHPAAAQVAAHGGHQRPVPERLGAAQFIEPRRRRGMVRQPRQRSGHILHPDRLQPGQATPEQRHHRGPAEHRQGANQRVTGTEQRGGPHHHGVGEGVEHRRFAPCPGANVRRRRVQGGADTGHLQQPGNAGVTGGGGQPGGAAHVDRLEGQVAALRVQGHRIDHHAAAGHGVAHRRRVPDVGGAALQPLFLVPAKAGLLRVSGHQADGMAPGKQRPDDVLTKKAAAAEHRD